MNRDTEHPTTKPIAAADADVVVIIVTKKLMMLLLSLLLDLVAGLNACGDLSDLALAFANQLHVPFVIFPCHVATSVVRHSIEIPSKVPNSGS